MDNKAFCRDCIRELSPSEIAIHERLGHDVEYLEKGGSVDDEDQYDPDGVLTR